MIAEPAAGPKVESPIPVGLRSRRRWAWFAVGSVLVSGLLVALALQYLRAEAVASSQRLTASVARLIEEQTTRTIQSVDLRLQLAAAGLAHLKTTGKLQADTAHELLRDQIGQLPFIRALWALDENGRLVHDSETGNLG
ncbi:MAG: hypothetical protein B7Z52_07465, partial [Burkholderiales bacterium 12-64-5]